MSDQNDEDFTQIKDLPNIERSEEEEDFSDLDSMAKDLGIEDTTEVSQDLDSHTDQNDLPNIPNNDTADSDFFNSPEDEEGDLVTEEESTFDSSEFDSSDFETSDFETQTNFSDDSFDSPSDFSNDPLDNANDQEEQDTTEDNFAADLFSDERENDTEQPNSDLDSLLTPESELSEEIQYTERKEKTEIEREEIHINKPPEDFEEVKTFAKNLTYGDFTAEGNPPFSVVIKDLKYYEDIELICDVLLEFKFINTENLTETKQKLERGQILIPRLSEYAAIILVHKLRSFDLEILMGLTEEINPPKSYHSNDRGLTSKSTLLNNKKFHKSFDKTSSNDKVMASTLSTIDGYTIREYLGVITHSTQISPDDLKEDTIEDDLIEKVPSIYKEKMESLQLHRENILASKSEAIDLEKIKMEVDPVYKPHSLDQIYNELVEELKKKAKTKEANAIVGINFTITPIGIENYLSSGPKYQILCSGNIVWLQKN